MIETIEPNLTYESPTVRNPAGRYRADLNRGTPERTRPGFPATPEGLAAARRALAGQTVEHTPAEVRAASLSDKEAGRDPHNTDTDKREGLAQFQPGGTKNPKEQPYKDKLIARGVTFADRSEVMYFPGKSETVALGQMAQLISGTKRGLGRGEVVSNVPVPVDIMDVANDAFEEDLYLIDFRVEVTS